MAASKFLKQVSGVLTEEAPGTSGGGGDAYKIPALDSNGRLASGMMPTGIGADTATVNASENLAAGDFVNIYNASGTPKVRKADCSSSGKPAHGFVLAAVTSGSDATVYFEGLNDQVSGMTGGDVFMSGTTAGAVTSSAPTGSGKVVQKVGVAVSATTINVEISDPIVLA